jgi:hypothetical protein
LYFENKFGFLWLGNKFISTPPLYRCIKLVVGAIWTAAKGMRKELSAPALETKTFFAVKSVGGTGAPPASGTCWALAATVDRIAIQASQSDPNRKVLNIFTLLA